MTPEMGEEAPVSRGDGQLVEPARLEPDPIRKRTDQLRWSTAIVLSGLILNAGLVVLFVALISDSIVVSLITVGLMAGIIVVSAVYHDVLTLRFTGARPLIGDEYPWIQPLVRDLAAKARVVEPAVYIADEEGMNAFTTGLGSKVKITFTSGLLRDLTEDEVRAVAAHEVGHAKNEDVALAIWTAAVSSWVGIVSWTVGIAVAMVVEFSKQLPKVMGEGSAIGAFVGIMLAVMGFAIAGLVWVSTAVWVFISRIVEMTVSRNREFLADATAVAITGEPEALERALAKINERPYVSRGANAVRTLCIASPFAAPGFWDRLLSTHPSPEHRIEELQRLGLNISSPDSDWEGVGPVGVVLPLGSLAILVLLAILIPLIVSSGGDDASASGGSAGQEYRPPTSITSVNPTPARSASPRPTAVRSDSVTPTPSPSPTVSPPPTPVALPVFYGETVNGTIKAPDETQMWSFSGHPGEIITVRMFQEGGASLRLYFALIDPSGSEIKTSGCGGPEARLQNFELPTEGIYVIRAAGCNGSIGGYSLSLVLKPAPEAIAYGQQLPGEIAIAEDYQDWVFTGHAGDVVTVRMLQEGGASLRLNLSLRDPSGIETKTTGCGGPEVRIQNFKLQFDGDHTLRASGCNGTTGGYSLALILKPGPGTTSYGETVQGSIAISGDYEDWIFTGEAGDFVTVTMSQSEGASLRLYFALMDPSGVEIKASGCGGPEVRLDGFTLSFSGDYTIRASGCNGTTGGYGLSVTKQ